MQLDIQLNLDLRVTTTYLFSRVCVVFAILQYLKGKTQSVIYS